MLKCELSLYYIYYIKKSNLRFEMYTVASVYLLQLYSKFKNKSIECVITKNKTLDL